LQAVHGLELAVMSKRILVEFEIAESGSPPSTKRT